MHFVIFSFGGKQRPLTHGRSFSNANNAKFPGDRSGQNCLHTECISNERSGSKTVDHGMNKPAK